MVEILNHQTAITKFDNAGKILYTDTNKEKTHTLTFKSNLGTQVENNRKIKIDVIAQQEI